MDYLGGRELRTGMKALLTTERRGGGKDRAVIGAWRSRGWPRGGLPDPQSMALGFKLLSKPPAALAGVRMRAV